jgi:hypothetical protein
MNLLLRRLERLEESTRGPAGIVCLMVNAGETLEDRARAAGYDLSTSRATFVGMDALDAAA